MQIGAKIDFNFGAKIQSYQFWNFLNFFVPVCTTVRKKEAELGSQQGGEVWGLKEQNIPKKCAQASQQFEIISSSVFSVQTFFRCSSVAGSANWSIVPLSDDKSLKNDKFYQNNVILSTDWSINKRISPLIERGTNTISLSLRVQRG